MRVYNLTTKDVTYRGRPIPPNGGSIEFGDIFVPNRDLELQTAGILSFGSLPAGWSPKVVSQPAPKFHILEKTQFYMDQAETKVEKLQEPELMQEQAPRNALKELDQSRSGKRK